MKFRWPKETPGCRTVRCWPVTAWREALRRAGPLRPEVYASMLSDASLRSPEVSPFLEAIGLSEHDLALPLSRPAVRRFFSIALSRNC
jgi:hypothetical protein